MIIMLKFLNEHAKKFLEEFVKKRILAGIPGKKKYGVTTSLEEFPK